MLVSSGALYLDEVEEDPLTAIDTPICMNTFPFGGQDGVPAADQYGSHPLHMTIVDIGSDGLSAGDTHIYVTTVDGGLVEVFDGTTFHVDWAATSSYAAVQSDGAGSVDEHRLILIRDTPFVSLDVLEVRLVAETTTAEALDKSYTFAIEDLTKPEVLSVETRTLRKLVVTFNEPIEKDTGVRGDALRIRDISGGTEMLAPFGIDPARIRASRDVFFPDDAGLFLGIAGAVNAANNDIFTIVAYISAREVEIDNPDILNEELEVDAIITVSPYRVNGVPDEALVLPYFNPVVVGALCLSNSMIELSLHTEITQQRLYNFLALAVDDLNDNTINPVAIQFTTENCGAPEDRDFTAEDMFPNVNLEEDATRDLIRFLRIMDEVIQLILCDIDEFPTIMDIDLIADNNLDAMLVHLGAPFSFAGSLDNVDKRRLASVLVEMYKRKGGEVAIEAIVAFILGFEIDVQPYLNLSNTWLLGVSQLGLNAFLGPGTSFIRYSFQVEVFDDLTETERRRLIEIVEYMKPSHTHFIRLIEPSTLPIAVFAP